MMKPLPPDNLAGLLHLAEKGDVDVRPTLLRILTDLYVQIDRHTDEEECQYTELALRLIDVVDLPARAATAATLAQFPGAPYAVIQRLAHDSLMVAAPVLRHSQLLSSNELEMIAAECGVGHAAVIAKRERDKATPPASISAPPATPDAMAELALAGHGIAPAPIQMPKTLAVQTLESKTSVPKLLAPAPKATVSPVKAIVPVMSVVGDAPALAPSMPDARQEDFAASLAPTLLSDADWPTIPAVPPTENSAPHELNELFYSAGVEERRLILLNLNYVAPTYPLRSSPTVAQSAFDRLEMAALSHRHDQFAQDLVKLLDISREQALRIMRDEFGEPIVVAAKALGMPAAILQRILLFVNPSVGESVERVYGLATLFIEIDRQAAEYMVSIWRATRPARNHGTGQGFGHQPLLADDGARDNRSVPAARRAVATGLVSGRRSA
jgi:hypothetical protein